MKTTKLSMAIALILSGAMAAGAVYAAKPPGAGGGGGGGGKPGGEDAAQNLSVPTIMVGTPPGGLACGGSSAAPSTLKSPTGAPLTGYEVDPTSYYWVQKVHTWQAQCFQAAGASVFGRWGDNLEGDAKLKTGSPIRVEIVLTNEDIYANPTTLQGYTVKKLEPSKLDRESAYGHLALPVGTGWVADPTAFPQLTTGTGEAIVQGWLVHDSQITFSVLNKTTGEYAVPPGTSPTAEINATGKVVYGYNLRVGVAGPYRIQFTSSPLVTFTDQDAMNGGRLDANNVYIDIVVTAGGGGGGKPPKKK